jgi:hypothetical protein
MHMPMPAKADQGGIHGDANAESQRKRMEEAFDGRGLRCGHPNHIQRTSSGRLTILLRPEHAVPLGGRAFLGLFELVEDRTNTVAPAPNHWLHPEGVIAASSSAEHTVR